jgi:hypothetical protein
METARLALTDYEQEGERIIRAEAEASEIVRRLRDDLNPLFADWTQCHLLTAHPVAPALLEMGHNKPIPVATFAELWERLNLAMVRYAEARQKGKAAFARMVLSASQAPIR